MTARPSQIVKLVLGVATVFVVMTVPGKVFVSGQSNNCGLQLGGPFAFCETFDQPSPVTNRSGQLNGTLWGVSRLTGAPSTDYANNWSKSTMDTCNGRQQVQPDTDVIICNGQARESSFDNFTVTALAMYPKQPFDFAGRTGTVSFEVTNDTSGTHGTWPEFWLTDQPVPAPFTHGDNGQVPCDFCSVPRNGFGIRFAAYFEANQGAQAPNCPNDSHRRWIVDTFVIVRNYTPQEYFWINNPNFTTLGCVTESGGAGGNGLMNHIELKISQNQIDVYASDAGSKTLKQITRLTNANLTLTRGLVWIEDSHYNAEKSAYPSTNNHTFAWDNVAFDGPAPYRDLSFDVLDRLSPGPGGTLNLGWPTSQGNAPTLQTLPMTSANISAATSSLLMFNYGIPKISTWTYSINGHVHTTATPVASPVSGWQSVALPVTLSDLVNGPQAVQIWGNQATVVANVNIVLVAAAPVAGASAVPAAPSNLRILSSALFKFPFMKKPAA
jgi:hypothetical protein